MLKLKGKTQKGKNRIRENGEFWEVLESRDKVLCCNGSGFLIRPINGKLDSDRWISQLNDPDFEIVK